VIRALPSEVLTAVRDLTRNITAATPDPYNILKDALLARFTPAPLQQCFRLLDIRHLGDRRPSALFAEMQALLPRDANLLFNAMFLRCLPEPMRSTLADRGELPPGDLAAAADLLVQATPQPVVAAVGATAPVSEPPSVHAAVPPPARPRSCSPSARRRQATPHRRAPSPGPRRRQLPCPPPDSQLCFYHHNFGRQAHCCQPPCQWPGNA
jgi:hypothetical protein